MGRSAVVVRGIYREMLLIYVGGIFIYLDQRCKTRGTLLNRIFY